MHFGPRHPNDDIAVGDARRTADEAGQTRRVVYEVDPKGTAEDFSEVVQDEQWSQSLNLEDVAVFRRLRRGTCALVLVLLLLPLAFPVFSHGGGHGDLACKGK